MPFPLPGTNSIYIIAPCLTNGRTPAPKLFNMLVYQSFGKFKTEAYKVYTAAEHLETYREEYPTRRRQLNAVKQDLQNMNDAIETIARQLAPVDALFASYLGNKYSCLDLYDMQLDLHNLESARLEIENTPCPAKVAKEEAKAAAEAAAADPLAELWAEAEADAAAMGMVAIEEDATPRTITIELPEGVTPFDISNIFSAAKIYAHEQRMESMGDGTKKAEIWAHIYDSALEIDRDQLHSLAWSTDTAVLEYGEKNCVIHI